MLFILVENLGFPLVKCREDNTQTQGMGYQTFCSEAVRFTHAYSPSSLSQAVIGSIWTGRYPYVTGLRHNGAQFLKAETTTLAEVALAKGFRTAFFSGGPPIFRRAGLNQGFEVFDDTLPIRNGSIFRPAAQTADALLSWLDGESSRKAFFAAVYFPDLQFPDITTQDDLGVARERSTSSQVEEVNESLAALIQGLKERKLWDNTNVILAGLNARIDPTHVNEALTASLYSDNTRIALFIKPARKNRETPFNWQIDSNVSLVDVGATAFDLLGAGREDTSEFASQSLVSGLLSPQPTWNAEHPILLENAWRSWRGYGPVYMAVRIGPYLYIGEQDGRVYNTVTDPFEATPLPAHDPQSHDIYEQAREKLARIGYENVATISAGATPNLDLARRIFLMNEPIGTISRKLDPEAQGWLARKALQRGEWTGLKTLARIGNQPTWAYVAARNLGEKVDWPSSPCFRLLQAKEMNPHELNECPRDEQLDVQQLYWLTHNGDTSSRLLELAARRWAYLRLDTAIAEHNYANGLIWDVALNMPGAPHIAELFLALPENAKLAAQFKRWRLSRVD